MKLLLIFMASAPARLSATMLLCSASQINPTIPFVDSSPSNGVIADNDREYVKRWGDDWDWRYGDVHWYAYESDCEDWTTYPK
jgi:beta-mannosidase